MPKDRLIWRPNEITLEDWEAMTREEQIAWWKSRRKPPGRKSHMKEAIARYDKGYFTRTDFVVLVCKRAAPGEIEEFVRVCPPDLLAALKDSLAAHGEDESTWPRLYYIATYAPWVSPEEIAESRRLEQEQIWSGVRLLKQYFSQG